MRRRGTARGTAFGLALLAAPLLAATPPSWPPRVGELYPDLELVDGDGSRVRLSDFAGKVLLIEPVGMNCPACQAFAGSGKSLGGVRPQAGLPDIASSFAQHAPGVALSDPRIVFVQLLLYDLQMQAPDAADVRAWTEAFPVPLDNRRVLAPAKDMRGGPSHAMVPGFQLVDAAFVLRSDASGHRPRNDLYRELLPLVPSLVAEVGVAHVASAPLPGEAEIAAAYLAIPHRRTTYRARGSALDPTVAEQLERVLGLVDAAVALRVGALAKLREGGGGEALARHGRELDALELALGRTEVTPRAAASLVGQALRAQRAYFVKWRTRLASGERFVFAPDDPQVQESSRCLKRAYAELMRAHPDETQANRQAFFDHLCALDFL